MATGWQINFVFSFKRFYYQLRERRSDTALLAYAVYEVKLFNDDHIADWNTSVSLKKALKKLRVKHFHDALVLQVLVIFW